MLKLLAVDDDAQLHTLYAALLSDAELLHAYDGVEALALLAQHQDTDLILLDLRMPRMDGLSFLTAALADPAYAHIPTIMVTTETTAGDAARALALGARAYLSKPFHPQQLTSLIDSVLAPTSPATLRANRTA